MKTLLIIRHGKADWPSPGQHDQERPLTATGIKRTEKIAEFLKSRHILPDLIISSKAVRAAATAEILADGLGYNKSLIKFEKSIYHATYTEIFDLFFEIPESVQKLAIIGHNPTLTDFSNLFLEHPIDNLPTTGVVCMSFDTDNWNTLEKAPVKTDFIIFPKLIH
jgi:phosphohistidine phosphatase